MIKIYPTNILWGTRGIAGMLIDNEVYYFDKNTLGDIIAINYFICLN